MASPIASLLELRLDPRARQEALARAQQLPPGHLAKLCQAQKKEAEDSTRFLRENWRNWWDLWQNEVHYPDKEEWQSQVWVPNPFTAVEQAAAVIKRSLLESPDFFGVSGVGQEDRVIAAQVWKPTLKVLLDRANFVPKYADATKVGFITGVAGYLKFRWATTYVPYLLAAEVDPNTGAILPSFATRPRSILAIDYVPPWRIFRDPDTTPRENFSGTYLYHSEWMERVAIAAMVDRRWNKDAVERLLASARRVGGEGDGTMTNSQREEAARKQQAWQRHSFRSSFLVDEGWLDILDENGDLVLPDALMIHAHEEILYGPVESPLWATDLQTGRRKWPFVAAAPLTHPTRFEGRGIIEQDEALSLMFSNTLNLFADGMNWKFNGGMEVYQAGLVDWDDTSDYPGKTWKKSVKERVTHAVQRGEISVAEGLAFLQFIGQLRQNSNFVTDFVIGLPGSRSDITLGEVKIKSGQGNNIFESMGKDLELGGRVAVEMAYDFALQFLGGNDYTDPSLAQIIGPHRAQLLAQLRIEERVRNLQGNYDFTFTGVTQALETADLLQRVMQFGVLAARPPYAGRTDPGQILRLIASLAGLDDRIDIYDPAPAPLIPGAPIPGAPAIPGADAPAPPIPAEIAPPAPALVGTNGGGG